MSLTFGLDLWLLLPAVLAAGGLTYWMYRDTVPRLTGGRRALLMGLRFAALAILLILLFEPLLRRVTRETQAPVLAVILDDSRSLRLMTGLSADDTTAATLPAALRDDLARLGPASSRTRFFAFGGEARAVPDPGALALEAERTDVAGALDAVRETLRDDNLRAVVLVSDGRYNTGRNPVYTAERYPVPIYTVTLGDTTRRRDVQVRRVTANEIGYLGTVMPVQVGVRADGYDGARVTVSLLQGGQVLASERVTLPAGAAEVPVDLRFTPTALGLTPLVAAVSRLDGETTFLNNSQGLTVQVLERRRRVLLLAAAPGPDVAALRLLLEADADAAVTTRVQQAPGRYYGGALPADLSGYDVLVLAGFPGDGVPRQELQRVAAAAATVPTLFVLSPQTDLNALQQTFAAALPAVPERVRGRYDEAAFVPTAAGLQHPVLAGTPPDAWRRLPPLRYNQSRWTPSPDARVLATVSVRGVALDDPLLVIRSRAGHRAAALLGAGTWRWKNVPEGLDGVATVWPDLLERMVQWLAAREDDRPVRVRPVRNLFGGDEAVTFTGQVYDESLNPVDDAAVEVTLTSPDGSRLPFQMDALGSGRYVLDVGTLPTGTYPYTAVARRGDAALGTDQGAFRVGALALEFRETRADAPLMRQIALRSGGRAVAAETLADLAALLGDDARFTPVVSERTRETPLQHLYGWLAVVLALLTTEWFLRKRSGMV